MPVQVREATQDDVEALAVLRWQSEQEGPGAGLGRDEYVAAFAAWWARHGARFRAVLAVAGDVPVGEGFLAVVARVPTPADLDRVHGDLQSMYVVPEHRDRGVGSAIVALLLDLARESGCSRVEVHSGRRAVVFYERAGFEHFPRLMNHHLGD